MLGSVSSACPVHKGASLLESIKVHSSGVALHCQFSLAGTTFPRIPLFTGLQILWPWAIVPWDVEGGIEATAVRFRKRRQQGPLQLTTSNPGSPCLCGAAASPQPPSSHQICFLRFLESWGRLCGEGHQPLLGHVGSAFGGGESYMQIPLCPQGFQLALALSCCTPSSSSCLPTPLTWSDFRPTTKSKRHQPSTEFFTGSSPQLHDFKSLNLSVHATHPDFASLIKP